MHFGSGTQLPTLVQMLVRFHLFMPYLQKLTVDRRLSMASIKGLVSSPGGPLDSMVQ